MEKKRKAWEILKGILVLGILIFLVWVTLKNIGILVYKGIEKLSNLASNFEAVIIVALITGSVSILGVIISSVIAKTIEYRQKTKRYLIEKREQPYADFVEMVYKVMKNSKTGNEYGEDEMLEDMVKFSQQLTLWGSSKVIKKWLQFRNLSQSNQVKPTDNLFIMEEILFEIRKDMGQPKSGLKQGDLLAFFVNDIKKYLPNNEKTMSSPKGIAPTKHEHFVIFRKFS